MRGDGGFQVEVAGKVDLTGAQITSTQAAIDAGKNRYEAQGGTTTTDLQNSASYSAQSVSVGMGAGGGSSGGRPGGGLGAVGIGTDADSARSESKAAISGVAGDVDARTGDREVGLAQLFDKEKVKAEVAAQVAITAEFGRQASTVVGNVAQQKMKLAESKLNEALAAAAAGDSEAAAGLRAEARQLEADWGDQGKLRLAAHTVIGGLTGGAAGAAGAAVGTLTAPQVAGALREAGIDETVVKSIAALASTAAGGVVGAAGGAAAYNEVVNNYVSHSQKREVRDLVTRENVRLTQACGDRCTQEEFRSIDAQLAKLEAAATLHAGLRDGSALTPAEAQQLSQFVLELLPIYGTAESLMQVLTGRSSVSGEQASRWLAGMGLVPGVGSVVRQTLRANAGATVIALRHGDDLAQAGQQTFLKIDDLLERTFEAIPLSHTKDFRTGKFRQDGVLGEQVAIQVLAEKTGLEFRPLQNASGHGCDGCAIAFDGDKIVVVVMDAKSSQNGITAAASAHGNPEVRLSKWLESASIAGSDAAMADLLRQALRDGAKVQGITVKVGVPAPGATGVATIKVEAWPKP